MPLRLYLDPAEAALARDAELDLPAGAARHAQVRRVQPGDALRLFDGHGGEWHAQVLAMTRQGVRVRVGAPLAVDAELPLAVTLALGVPAHDRMDALVEKATELGVARLQPLDTERSVLRLDGARAERRRAHWQAVAVAAAEQCGRARVPAVAPTQPLAAWLHGADAAPAPQRGRWVLSLAPDHGPPAHALAAEAATPGGPPRALVVVSGPEGGLAAAEDAALRAAGFRAVGLGPRVLRADTAPLALLAWLGLQAAVPSPTTAGAGQPGANCVTSFPPIEGRSVAGRPL